MGLFQEFSESTSMHGLQRAVSSESKWKRPLWAALVLAGACLATFNLSQTLKDFLHNPTTTQTSVHYNPDMEFPVITICNLNPFRSSLINAVTDSDFIENLWRNPGNFTYEDVVDLTWQYYKMKNVSVTHQLEATVMTCKFGTGPRGYGKFLPSFNLKYTTKPGPSNGLILELNVQQSEYLSATESAGFKIAVRPRDTLAFPEDQGLIVMPGTNTNIGLKKVEMSRTPPPYSACVELTDEPNVELNMFSFTEGTRYTAEACRKTCYMRELVRQCGCCDLHFICPPEIYNNISFCNATNTDEFVCKKQVLKMFEKGELDCLSRCLPPCEEVVYDVALSTAIWPSNNAIPYKMTALGFDQANLNTAMSEMKRNFLRVAIFYEDLAVRRVESRPSYDWNRLLSDIGGQLGLWLGFSILTAMEWLELAYDAGIRATTRMSLGAQTTRAHGQEQGP
ncbi:degenerin deg-1-like [Aplysia californica]|uniref:Degenerin deg-1-like n=1 Tax=Aplysia californica TaxID=6500 RepID=A0ABM1A7S7_APLCA|nr:degenerin deg-1-like [Aplysia californica]